MAGIKGRSGGHNRKPTALRILEGNPGKRPLPKDEPQPPAGKPKVPVWVQGSARKLWRQIAPALESMGVLTTVDTHALGMLVDAYAQYLQAKAVIDKEGLTYEKERFVDQERGFVHVLEIRQRPEVPIMQDAWKRVLNMMVQFGVTPASRSRLHVEKAPAEDPLDALRREG